MDSILFTLFIPGAALRDVDRQLLFSLFSFYIVAIILFLCLTAEVNKSHRQLLSRAPLSMIPKIQPQTHIPDTA